MEPRESQRPGRVSLAHQAWLILPLAVLVGALILLFGDTSEDSGPQVTVVERSAQGLVLQAQTGAKPATAPGFPAAIPGETRQQVLARLAELRADYKQQGLDIRVSAQGGAADREAFARQVGNWLATHQIGRYERGTNVAGVETPTDAVLHITVGRDELVIARALVDALAPVISGRVAVQFREGKTETIIPVVVTGGVSGDVKSALKGEMRSEARPAGPG